MKKNDLSFVERFINHVNDDECGCYTDDEGFHICEEQEALHRMAREEKELKENIVEKGLNFEALKRRFGVVEFEGKQIFMKEDAFADGINDQPIYIAHAIDKEGNDYTITWEQYETDSENECFVDEDGEPMGSWDDGANACNWDEYTVEKNT